MSQIKKELVILKLDFENVFDKVEHEVILKVMEHKGFPGKWPRWIKGILTTGTSSLSSSIEIKRILQVPFAIEIIIVMSWCIWKERNS
jgi:hypothetical protein